jgi:hypothetical protein
MQSSTYRPKVGGSCGGRRCWVEWIDNVACEEARVQRVVSETKAVKDCFNFCVQVTGALVEAIQTSFEEPVFVLLGVGVAQGWFNNRDLVVWENALAKSVLAVALFECVLPFNSHAD